MYVKFLTMLYLTLESYMYSVCLINLLIAQ